MKIAVLISGRGSNLRSIINDSKQPNCPYTIAVVIANKECPGLRYADEINIPIRVISYKGHARRDTAEGIIDGVLNMFGVDLVVLAGFMKVLTPYLVSRWKNRIINIHPALLPSFPGLHTHEQALNAGVKFHGVTVHFVDEGTDTGPIIAQRCVPVWPSYDADALATRVLEEEHEILPTVLRMIADNKISVVNGKVCYEKI